MFETPSKIASLMRDFKPDWFIAGGWAIDLFLEKQTRPHEDIEIALLRRDQVALQNYLDKWTFKKAVNGELSDWKKNEFLQLPIHEIHCFNEMNEPPFLEILLNETTGDEWTFRRNANVTKPISKLYSVSKNGIKFLRPEIVLLYKSKNPRTKDEHDLQAIADFLGNESKEWLKDSLLICYPQKHHWLKRLKKP